MTYVSIMPALVVWYSCVMLVEEWEAVCDYSWGCHESIVACHQLGYPGGNNLYYA